MEHDPNDPVRGGLRTSTIFEVAHVLSFSLPLSPSDEVGRRRAGRRPRERENGIASRHAYEIGSGGDIKVVPVRRGATADKWPEMLAKLATREANYFSPARERQTERETGRKFISVESRYQEQAGEKSRLIRTVENRSVRPRTPPTRRRSSFDAV